MLAIEVFFKKTETHEFFRLATVLYLNDRLSGLVDDFKGKMLHVRLDLSIFEFSANETLGVKDTK